MTTKKTWKQHWKSYLVIVGLLVGSIAFFYMSLQPLADLNDIYDVERNNAASVFVWGNGSYVLIVGSVTNATSDKDTTINFWYNTSYIQNVTMFVFAYYNGTHSYDNWEGRFLENGHPDYSWWTDSISLDPSFFGNGSEYEWRGYRIPAQRANTTVEYLVVLKMEVDSVISYRYYERNYTVLYSEGENEELRIFTQASFFYTGALCFTVASLIWLQHQWSLLKHEEQEKRKATGSLVESVDDLEYPDARDLVQRADRMDSARNELQTASSLILALSIGYFLFLGDTGGLLVWSFLGAFYLAILALTSIMISLSSTVVYHSGKKYDLSLLPDGDSKSEFRNVLNLAIRQRVILVSKMRAVLQLGVIGIIGSFLFDIVWAGVWSFEPLLVNDWSRAIVFAFFIAAAASIFLAIHLGLRYYGVHYLQDIEIEEDSQTSTSP